MTCPFDQGETRMKKAQFRNMRKLIKRGTRFGRLKVLKNLIDFKRRKCRHTKCYCLCDCGNMTSAWANELRSGHTKSCGCLRVDLGKARRTHGLSRTSEYVAWYNMIRRCTDPNVKQWKDYGGRGITVCQRWLKSFPNFIKDMGSKPSPELTLERFFNYEGYKPSNCVWETRKNQIRNRRNSVIG